MSGGSYDYLYSRMEDAAQTLRGRHADAPHVIALADRLDALADVMHDIEWADSCDTLWTPDLDARIRSLLTPGAERAVATDAALRAIDALRDVLSARQTTEGRDDA